MAIVATHVAAVQELYVAYFGRPADPAGLDYWTNVVEAQGGSTTAVSASFATQPEYIVAFFQKTPAQIVDQIYANMFARGASTTDGRSYWVDLLTKGTVGVSTIVAEIMNGATGTDAVAVENKIEAATAFTNALDQESEQAGYAGADALTLAKAWITGITTDATLTAATTPAALDAQVAAIVKAGTPFALPSALAQLQTAERALDKFLTDNELSANVATAKSAVAADLVTATNAVDTLVDGVYNPTASAAVASALLADQQKKNSDNLKAANTELANANAEAAGVTGLSAAIANLRTASTASTAAAKAAGETQVDLTVATNEFNTRTGETAVFEALLDGAGKPLVLTAGTAVVSIVDASTTPATETDLVIVNARGNFVLASGITEADYPGITALRDALTADFYADTEAYAAAQTLDSAGKVKVIADNTTIVDRVMDAHDDTVTGVAARQKAIDDLAEAVADRAEVVALQSALNKADKAVTDLQTEFTTNGFATPAPLDQSTASGTAASDIFMLGDAENVSITGFGRLGEDSLYVGNNYVLNAGALESGNNSAMEVFFVQNGNRAEVHVETAAYGSSSDDVIVVSLVGVEVADLQLVDGIISLKAGA